MGSIESVYPEIMRVLSDCGKNYTDVFRALEEVVESAIRPWKMNFLFYDRKKRHFSTADGNPVLSSDEFVLLYERLAHLDLELPEVVARGGHAADNP